MWPRPSTCGELDRRTEQTGETPRNRALGRTLIGAMQPHLRAALTVEWEEARDNMGVTRIKGEGGMKGEKREGVGFS